MKKVVFIEPKSSHLHVYSAVPIPRLGSVLMGTMLRDRGYEVKVYIEEISDVSVKDVFEADLVGISVISSTAVKSYEWAERIRKAGIRVVLGGQHVTYLKDEALDYADFVVRGEGEDTMMELVDALEGDKGFSGIAGLSYYDGGKKVHNPDRPLPTDLDQYPIPDFRLVQGKNKFGVISLMTARGCPFGCSFCSVTNFNGKGYRTMSVERTLEHLEYYWKNYDVHYFFFADDIFNLNTKRAKAIVQGMIDRGITPLWGAQVRHEIVRDPEMLDLFRRANCDRVYVGFESINQATLDSYGKGETVEEVENSMKVFHKHGIKVHGMFVLGSDSDTVETIHETLRFVQKNDFASIQFMILTPIPGSKDFEAYDRGEKRLLSRNWSHYDGHHCLHEPKQMTPYELQSETMKAMRRFYGVRGILKQIWRWDWREAVMRSIGWKLTRRWAKNHDHYVLQLKEDMFQRGRNLLPQLPSRPKKRVAIAYAVEDATAQKVLETFLKELGVKVVKSKTVVSDWMVQGKDAVVRNSESIAKNLGEFISEVRGKVDCVLLPVVQEKDDGDKKSQFPDVGAALGSLRDQWTDYVSTINFDPDYHSAEFRQKLTQLGLAFTPNFKEVRKAVTKALEIAPQPLSQGA